jgi:hypothetical protein
MYIDETREPQKKEALFLGAQKGVIGFADGFQAGF